MASDVKIDPTVLILDDNFDIVELISLAIEDMGGVNTLIETDPWRALKLAKGKRLAAIFIDYNIPSLNGGEFFKMLSTFDYVPPVCFVTGFSADIPNDILSHNKVKVIQKPFKDSDIQNVLSHFIEDKNAA